jgi:hypothetical protein
LPGRWSEVSEVKEIPSERKKKNHRVPEGQDHRALYRRYDDVFPGVQKKREAPLMPSNPNKLKVQTEPQPKQG